MGIETETVLNIMIIGDCSFSELIIVGKGQFSLQSLLLRISGFLVTEEGLMTLIINAGDI